jgi:hypothetical protein
VRIGPDIISFIAVEAGLFGLGVFLGVLWFNTIALPILYVVPRASWWAFEGLLRWWIVPLSLVSPILWSALFAGGVYLLVRFAPDALEQLYSSAPLYLGLWLGISVGAFRAVGTKFGRRKLHDDFLNFVRSRFKRQHSKQEEQWDEDIYQRVWHLSRGGRRYGPFTYEELHRRAARGEIHDGDLLWRRGVAEWVEASSILRPVPKGKP